MNKNIVIDLIKFFIYPMVEYIERICDILRERRMNYDKVIEKDRVILASDMWRVEVKKMLKIAKLYNMIDYSFIDLYDVKVEELNRIMSKIYDGIMNNDEYQEIIRKIKENNILYRKEGVYDNEQISILSDGLSKYIREDDFDAGDYAEHMINNLSKANMEQLKYKTRGIRGEKIWFYYHEAFIKIKQELKDQFMQLEKTQEQLLNHLIDFKKYLEKELIKYTKKYNLSMEDICL